MPFPTFKSQAEIPEAFRAEYEEREGAWVAKVPDVSKVEETLGKVRQEKKDAEKLAREAGERAAELQRKLDAKDATGADTDKKVADMLAKWEQDKQAAVKAVQDELEKVRGDLRTVTLDDKLKAAFLASGGRPERVEKAINDTKRHFDLLDGAIVHKDEKGTVTTTKAEEFYAKLYRAEMPEFYTGTRATGGGAGGGAGTKPATGSGTAGDRVLKDPLAALQEANAQAA